MQSVIPAKAEIKRRIIFDYELIYIEDGEFVLNYNEIDYKCQKGDFILLRPGVPHSFTGIDCDLSQPHIHFDITHVENSPRVPVCFKDIDALNNEEHSWMRKDIFQKYPKTPFVYFTEQEDVLELFYEIVSTPGISVLTRKAKLIQIIDKLIFDNFPDVFEQSNTVYRIEKKVKDYIDAGQGMSSRLEDIAKQFNYSKYYLDHRFKVAYGTSLIAYRNEKRMLLAKEMLETETVSKVSEKLGFSSIYVFSRAFNNFFGCPPSYLKHNKNVKKLTQD